MYLLGVAFKEGFCYGKWEAAGLFGTIPLLLLGHLSGIISIDGERGLLASLSILITVGWCANRGTNNRACFIALYRCIKNDTADRILNGVFN
jgi:hypothetical protein